MCGDLNSEHLSTDNERKRQTFALTLNDLIEKVYVFDPNIGTKLKKKKPGEPSNATPFPATKKPAPPPPPPNSEGQPGSQDQQDEDYLEFTPNDGSVKEAAQDPELYEDMHTSAPPDEPEALYEESDPTLTSERPSAGAKGGDDELYQDPEPSGEASTVQSQELAPRRGSEEESPYADTKARSSRDSMMSLDSGWEYDITVKPSDKKVKAGELKNVKCKGVLEKLGGAKGETWQKRYCVLSETFMYFYDNEASRSFKNRIVVPMYAVSLSSEHTKKKFFAFKLSSQNVAGKKDYHFRTKSDDERSKWVNALKEVESASSLPQPSSSTMRAAPTQPTQPTNPIKRASSVGDLQQEEEYQDMIPEEKEGDVQEEEYEEVVPPKPGEELTESMEEYVPVQPVSSGDPEDYEDPNAKQESPKPSPKASHPIHPPIKPSRSNGAPPLPSKPQTSAPVPPSSVTVDTDKVYTHAPEGVQYDRVYALLWDFVTTEKDEVSLKRGDLVYVQDPKPSAQWWLGELLDPDVTCKVGRKGYFPTSYAAAAFEIVL